MKTFTEKLMECVAKRDSATRSYRKCTNCGSEQVQLISYLGDSVVHKCRKCHHVNTNTNKIYLHTRIE